MSFENPDVFFRPCKLLTDYEKKEILEIYDMVYKTKMPHISINDWLSIKLGAKENDIICMRNGNTEIYRMVVIL
jgi:DNA-directed RNA polymerase subunit H (RpoH/RPB5)